MMRRLAARLEVVDPGFARLRRRARTACATVLAWAALVALTSVFGVAEPLRITLFGAGACFFGALLVNNPQRSERVRTLGCATHNGNLWVCGRGNPARISKSRNDVSLGDSAPESTKQSARSS